MSGILIALGLVAAGLAGVAVWLAVGRGRLAAEAAAAREAKEQAEGRAAELSARLEEERAAREAERGRAQELESDLSGALQRHELELRNQSNLFEQREESARQAHEAALKHERAVLDQRSRGLDERQALIETKLTELEKRSEATFGNIAAKVSDELVKRADDRFKVQQQAGAAEIQKRQEAVERLLTPIKETLDRTGQTLTQFKQERAAADARLEKEIQTVSQIGSDLRTNTADLVQLLQSPKALGQYGETQLRRVAEFAGMRDYCDFDEQVQVVDPEGERYRPDMVVRLPSDRRLVVDAKASLIAIGQAAQNATTDEEREECLDQFAANVLSRVNELGKKNYWQFFSGSPQMVVLFLPGEQFLDAAFRRRPQIIELAAAKNVVIASPSTLIALIRGVAMAWKQEALAEQWASLTKLGVELHQRVEVVLGHALGVGEALEDAIKHYNKFVASAERNLLTTARRFEKFDVKSGKTLPTEQQMEPITIGVELPRHGTVDADEPAVS